MATDKSKSLTSTQTADTSSALGPLAAPSSQAVIKGESQTVATPGVHPVSLDRIEDRPQWRRRQRFALAALVLIALAAGGRYGHDWLVRGQFIISTDDAYVRSDLSIISPKVTGYATAILVAENAQVKAGDLLVKIEPGDYRIVVDAARGKIATQEATIARIGHQIEAQGAAIAQKQAQHAAVQAELTRTLSDLERTRALVKRAISSRKLLDATIAGHARAVANLRNAEAAITAARAQRIVLQAQREEARSTRDEYRTVLRKAERDLASTQIRAPFSGVIGNLAVKQGQLVEPGTRLLALVPLDKIYIEANFKETQIERLKVGQRVDIIVDAYRDEDVAGHIESIAPAAGQEFSLLPPQNATGNFTKIVQRVPVRISIPADVIAGGRLRPGLSVVARVNTLDPEASPPTLLGLMGWAHADTQ